MFAGNTPTDELYDPKGALKSRLHVIDFPEYSFEYKIKSVWEKIIPDLLAESNKFSKVLVTLQDFTNTDREKVDEIVKKNDFRTIKTRLKNILLRKELDKAQFKKVTMPEEIKKTIL